MTIAAATHRISYPGTGSTGPFPFYFRVLASTDLRVVKRSGTDSITVLSAAEYTVAGVGDSSGTVTLATALELGETLVILRAPALTQPVSLANQASYFGQTHETEFDRIVMQMLGVDDTARRSIRVDESYDPDLLDLDLIPETGKAVVWQSTTQIGNSTIDSSSIALPGESRTVATASAYLMNNRVFNILDYAPDIAVIDDAVMMQAAIDAAAATGGIIIVPPRAGGYSFRSAINLTTLKTAKGLTIRGIASQSSNAPLIDIRHTGHGFDCTGAVALVFDNLSIGSNVSNALPQTAFFLAREDNPSGAEASSNQHRFLNVRVRGYFRHAVLYSYGSEELDLNGCVFENQLFDDSGLANPALSTYCPRCVIWTAFNAMPTPSGVGTTSLSSSFVTVASGQQSNIGLNIFGGSYSTGYGTKADTIYLDGASSVNLYGVWMLAGGTKSGRALIYVDATNGTSDNVHINGMHGESVGVYLHQKFGVLFGAEAGRTHTGWSIHDAQVYCGAADRAALTVGITNGSPNITSAGLFSNNDVGAVVSGTGISSGTRILSVTSANAAVLDRNATATNASASLTLAFRWFFSGPAIVLDSLRMDGCIEPDLRGVQIAATLQNSFISTVNSRIYINAIDKAVLMGNSVNWTISADTNTVKIDTLTGVVDSYTSLKVRGTQVVGQRRTGWTDQTAPPARIDLGATPTVDQLASAFRALYDDLKTHGLVGT